MTLLGLSASDVGFEGAGGGDHFELRIALECLNEPVDEARLQSWLVALNIDDVSQSHVSLAATSATRSVPLGCLGEVRETSAPKSNAASAIRMSSVAMMTWESSLPSDNVPRRAESGACPSMGKRGLPGNRVEAQRAGMMAAAVILFREG